MNKVYTVSVFLDENKIECEEFTSIKKAIRFCRYYNKIANDEYDYTCYLTTLNLDDWKQSFKMINF